ncbi:MAG: hypothetical protein ACO3ND_09725 [Opitutales bacterium]
MAKVDIEVVQRVLKESGVEVRLVAEILRQIRDVAAEDAVEREKPVKKQHVVLVSEPEEGLPRDLVGWVAQLPEDDDPRDVADKIAEAAAAFNASSKGQKLPLKSFGDACQGLPAKTLKERYVWLKTREPVRVIAVRNGLGRRRAAD